jgi:hypothetical protein
MTAKYKANNYAKLIFASTESEMDNYHITSAEFIRNVDKTNPLLSTRNEALFVIPKILEGKKSETMIAYNTELQCLELLTREMPLDAIFFHEFSHCLSFLSENLSAKAEMIRKRFPYTSIEVPFSNGSVSFSDASPVLKAVFGNDEEYRNMFGFTQFGLYPIRHC